MIIDLFSRRVVGWAISNRMKQDLALRALNMAIAIRRPPPGCAHHTDRGSQYCAHDYQKLLRKNGFKVSPLADVNIRCPLPGRALKMPEKGAADERQGQLVTTIPPPLGRFALQIACRATVESFFKSLKAELVWRRNWQTRRKVEIALFPSHGLQANHCRATEYINGFYNPRRKHSAHGWKSPVAFEQRAA